MQFTLTKLLVALASASVCLAAATPHATIPQATTPKATTPKATAPKHVGTSDLLVRAAAAVASAESAVKKSTVGLNKTEESFRQLAKDSYKLGQTLQTSAGLFTQHKGNLSSQQIASVTKSLRSAAADVRNATGHLIKIAPALKKAGISQEFGQGLVGLQKLFADLGTAIKAKLPKSKAAQSFSSRDVEDKTTAGTTPSPKTTTPKATTPKSTPKGSSSNATSSALAAAFRSIDRSFKAAEKVLSADSVA